jgi:ferredoxin
MSSGKFHIENRIAEPRFTPKGKFSISRDLDACINCGRCAALCVYGVHGREELDVRKMAEPIDYLCRDCFMCTQGCPKQALEIGLSDSFHTRGDALFSADTVASLMNQANRGSLPVFGSGYRGPFSGEGFDAMWTDMSEIVRPTRDGIHGREYISTAVDLGRKPMDLRGLEFDERGDPLFNIPPTVEIKLPLLFGRLPFAPEDRAILRSMAGAAVELGTFLMLDIAKIDDDLQASRNHIIPSIDPSLFSWSRLAEIAREEWILELRHDRELAGLVRGLKEMKSDLILIAELALGDDIDADVSRAAELVESGVDILHLSLDPYAPGNIAGDPAGPGTIAHSMPAIHAGLVERGVRDQVSIIVSGDICMAEHVPKSILLGADAVVVGTPMLIALECTVCDKCRLGESCPMELERVEVPWGQARIVNLTASWQNQLLEILGAMGLREVSRLRGELGRAIFKDQLEEELFAGLGRVSADSPQAAAN